MDGSPISSLDLALVLAITGRADADLLAAVWGLTPDALRSISPDRRLRWEGSAGAAADILNQLEQTDLPRYLTWHERALAHLAVRLQAGEEAWELAFMAVLERLANRLVLDPPALARVIESIQTVPLRTKAHRQMVRYLAGLALAKNDRYMEALVVYDGLLLEADLGAEVRGRALNSRANACRVLGRLAEASRSYEASLELWQSRDNPLRAGMALHNLGILAYQLQDYVTAEAQLTRAQTCFKVAGSSQWWLASHNELGLVYRDLGRWKAAQACFEQVVAQRRAEGVRDAVGRGLINVAETLLYQGSLAEAAAICREALAALSTQTYAIDAHLAWGLASQASGDWLAARRSFEQALAVAQTIGRQEILPHVYYRLGDVCRRVGDGATTLVYFSLAAEAIEVLRTASETEPLKISLLGRWQQVYEALVLYCLSQGQAAEAFEWAERVRARAFAEGGRGVAARTVTLAELQACCPAQTTILYYFTTGVLEQDIPLLRALSPDNPVQTHLLIPPRTLLFSVRADRYAVHACAIDPNAFATQSPRGVAGRRFWSENALHQLQTRLLPPTVNEPEVTAAGRRWVVIPHGPLHQVPFAALFGAPGADLIYAPSATLWVYGQATPPRSTTASGLAVGYDSTRLRYAEIEAEYVARRLGGEVWRGTPGTKTRLRAAARHARWLHLACHGRFEPDNPLASWLAVAPDERLTAQEVLETWQVSAELVVLSACQSGVSRVLRGDEPLGLARAFLQAGAQAVLVCQWPVEDWPTFLFMHQFYEQLQSGAEAARALAEAQQWLAGVDSAAIRALMPTLTSVLEEDQTLPPETPPFAHPRFWAGFRLVAQAACVA